MRPTRLAVLMFLALAAGKFPAPAQSVAFDSFGSGNSYSTATVWGVSGAGTSAGYRGQAQFFTAGVSGYLDTIKLATYNVSGSKLSNFYIVQNNGGVPAATPLEDFLNVQNVNGLLTINSAVKPLLQAGTEYWICDEPAASNSYNGWYYNNQGLDSGFAFERSEWSWSAIGAPAPASGVFEVTVTPVPEASATELVMLGGMLLLGCFKQRRAGRPGLTASGARIRG